MTVPSRLRVWLCALPLCIGLSAPAESAQQCPPAGTLHPDKLGQALDLTVQIADLSDKTVGISKSQLRLILTVGEGNLDDARNEAIRQASKSHCAYVRAAQHLRQYLAANPGNTRALAAQKRIDAAISISADPARYFDDFIARLKRPGGFYFDLALETPDPAKAADYYRKSAAEGHEGAMNNLGVAYHHGRGVPQDYAEAFQWFLKAAQAGNRLGMYSTAMAYENGRGVQKDVAQARHWYAESAARGHAPAADALKRLGAASGPAPPAGHTASSSPSPAVLPPTTATAQAAYQGGYDAYVRKDYAAARAGFMKAAEEEHSNALFYLGYMAMNGLGEPPNPARAITFYRRAAGVGNESAMNNLGSAYAKGQGVEIDDVAAAGWYRRAAEAGSITGMENFGRRLSEGRGVTKDPAAALTWFRKAADKGNGDSMNLLGIAHHKGEGVARDYVAAMAWYEKAWAAGTAAAAHNIGLLFEYGLGRPIDLQTARSWFEKSAAKGHEPARQKLAKLGAPHAAATRAAGNSASAPAGWEWLDVSTRFRVLVPAGVRPASGWGAMLAGPDERRWNGCAYLVEADDLEGWGYEEKDFRKELESAARGMRVTAQREVTIAGRQFTRLDLTDAAGRFALKQYGLDEGELIKLEVTCTAAGPRADAERFINSVTRGR